MPFILEGGATDQDGIGFLKPEGRGEPLVRAVLSIVSVITPFGQSAKKNAQAGLSPLLC